MTKQQLTDKNLQTYKFHDGLRVQSVQVYTLNVSGVVRDEAGHLRELRGWYHPGSNFLDMRVVCPAVSSVLGTQRGGSYGLKSGEPIIATLCEAHAFVPNTQTLETRRLERDGVGGLHGVTLKNPRRDTSMDDVVRSFRPGLKIAVEDPLGAYYGYFEVEIVTLIAVREIKLECTEGYQPLLA